MDPPRAGGRGRWEGWILPGDEDLFAPLYDELRDLAALQMRSERADHTLQPTALVHEAWLRMQGLDSARSWSATRFRVLAARVLRNVLVDHARARNADKRGAGGRAEVLGETFVAGGDQPVPVEELERALRALAKRDERQAQVVEMHFYGGLSFSEVAECLGVSSDTAKRDWRIARAWLNRALERGIDPGPGEA